MEKIISSIKTLMQEHDGLLCQTDDLGVLLGEISASCQMDTTKNDFLPGRMGHNLKTELEALDKSLERFHTSMNDHFDREESALLEAIRTDGNRPLVTALKGLLDEHASILQRFEKARQENQAILSSNLSREIMEGRAWALRTYITHTISLLKLHAQSEQEIFEKLHKELTAG